jgi:hypothetical protein
LEKTSACGSINHVYFFCLIDWGKILTDDELMTCNQKITSKSKPDVDGWTTKTLDWATLPELSDIITKAEFGFYHSRIIFKFDLRSTLENLQEIRKIRERLESKIKDYCSKKIIPVIKAHGENVKDPLMFIYPVFELNRYEPFWRFAPKRPYSMPTTCFYTELNDPEGFPFFGRNVKLRISGAKIIASDMSKWFFEILVSIIFHEGLYRQTRDKRKNGTIIKQFTEEIFVGLENRLEDFAGKLLSTFHEYSSEQVRRRIALFALSASVVGILIALANFFGK